MLDATDRDAGTDVNVDVDAAVAVCEGVVLLCDDGTATAGLAIV